ncbi:BlaI/MecI/CopY family transcriptional regulator [Halocola ammonii]
MKELTKAEEQVMQVLWELEKGFVKEIIPKLPSPKPAYNTVSTIVRILEQKGFVKHESFGRSHRYFPIVDKDDYTEFATDRLMKGYFDNSVKSMISFFVNEKKMSIEELDEVLETLKNQKK